MNGPAEVVYIAGTPRSGSTIVSLLLGEVPGFFNAGEVRFLWRQIARSGSCGCGKELPCCDVWAPILDGDVSRNGNADSVERLVQASETHSLIRTLPVAMARRRLLGGHARSQRAYAERMLPVYEAISRARDSALIVDASKSPSYAHLLATSPGLRVHVLHLVRDPRAVVYSVLRERGNAMPAPLRVRAILYHAAKWTAWNLWTETLVRSRAASYVRVVYEDFLKAPYADLQRLVVRYGREGSALPLNGPADRVATLSVNHTLFGNGYRFQVGRVPIRVDDEWRTDMRWHERALVTALTWPLLARYRRRTS